MCRLSRFIYAQFLLNENQLFDNVRAYIATESGSFCAYVFDHLAVFDRDFTNETLKCEFSTEGHYDPRCRNWYQVQKQNPSQSTITDIYGYAGSGETGIS